jgi:SanA protein
MRPSVRRRLQRWLLWGVAGFLLAGLGANRWVINSTDAYLYTNDALLPATEVGIVLGTSHYARDGSRNQEFQGRIRAAAQLYRDGKVRHLIVSGANPDKTYNEPRQMRRALIELGVPGEAITMDFAGFRTLDSVVRAQTVWGLDRYTLITQRYHAYRALFLARKLGMNGALAYAARIGETEAYGNRHPTREVFARLKAVLDVFVLNTQPRYTGEREPLVIPTPAASPSLDEQD